MIISPGPQYQPTTFEKLGEEETGSYVNSTLLLQVTCTTTSRKEKPNGISPTIVSSSLPVNIELETISLTELESLPKISLRLVMEKLHPWRWLQRPERWCTGLLKRELHRGHYIHLHLLLKHLLCRLLLLRLCHYTHLWLRC
jgi:hypothetical protein